MPPDSAFTYGLIYRPELETKHAQILSQDLAVLFDRQLIRRQTKAGDLGVDSVAPVFLVIQSREDHSRPISSALCCGQQQLMRLVRADVGVTSTIFELTKSCTPSLTRWPRASRESEAEEATSKIMLAYPVVTHILRRSVR